MGQRIIAVPPQDLLRLVQQASDGQLPNDAELVNLGQSQMLGELIALRIKGTWNEKNRASHSGNSLKPMNIRYESGKVRVLDEKGAPARELKGAIS